MRQGRCLGLREETDGVLVLCVMQNDPGTVCGAGAPDVHYAAGPWKLAPDEVGEREPD